MKAFWTGVAIMLLIAGVVWLGQDYLQEKTDIHNPNSEVGQRIDEALPGVKYHQQYTRARSELSKLELINIRTAITMYITKYGENPSSLQDLVDTRCIDEGALQDTFRQDYRLREVDGQMVLMSSGADQILGTKDDVTMSLNGTMLASPAEPEASDTGESQTGTVKTSSGRSLDMFGPAGTSGTGSTGADDTSVRIP
jgi:hypothetical protein